VIDRADVHTLPLPGLERWRLRSAVGGRGGQLVHAVRSHSDQAACGLEPRRGWGTTLHIRATCPHCVSALKTLQQR
jgi:hypothetical protein